MKSAVRVETAWGTWDRISVFEVAAEMAGFRAPWWIAGGFAIEAFVGRPVREHTDVDVALLHRDHRVVQAHLREWELKCADPPGALRRWDDSEVLAETIHDVWVRRDEHDAWRFQLMLDRADGDEWVCRRDPRIRLPLTALTFEKDGVPYLKPEVQLFYKARGKRPKDEVDFAVAAPLLSSAQRSWLRDALTLVHPGHPWLAELG